MTIAFWNINNNTELGEILAEFAAKWDIDILFLAESKGKGGDEDDDEDAVKGKARRLRRKNTIKDICEDFIQKYKIKYKGDYFIIHNDDFRIKTISRLNPSVFSSKRGLVKSSRWSALHVSIPTKIAFNIFPVHFQSKVNWSEASQAMACVNFARDIAVVEEKTHCYNSILIGDFNMNPWEAGMVSANGLHALQDLEYLSKKSGGRTVDGNHYKFFYNPMWGFLGDKSRPYGTMYHRTAQHVSQDWNIFDQVILRPEMKAHITDKSVNIITSIAGESLLSEDYRPDDTKYSDHLPILIKLTL